MGWLGGEPPDFSIATIPLAGMTVPPSWRESIVDRDLSAGVRIVMERSGFVRYFFRGWAPGERREEPEDEYSFEDDAAAVNAQLALMNAHRLLVHSSVVRLQAKSLGPGRVGHADLVHGRGHDFQAGGPGLFDSPFLVSNRDSARFLSTSTAALDAAAGELERVLNHADGERVVGRLDILNRAMAAFSNHESAHALIDAWTICEQLIQQYWTDYVERAGGTLTMSDGLVVERMNARRRQLLEGTAYPVSVVLQVLELAGEISHERFRTLNAIRSGRNGWMHDMRAVDADLARRALLEAAGMLDDRYGFQIRLAPTRGLSG